jgi:hypothetical protein
LQKGVEAPEVLLELQADPVGADVDTLAFIQVDQLVVVARLGAAVRRVLFADGIPGSTTADRNDVG